MINTSTSLLNQPSDICNPFQVSGHTTSNSWPISGIEWNGLTERRQVSYSGALIERSPGTLWKAEKKRGPHFQAWEESSTIRLKSQMHGWQHDDGFQPLVMSLNGETHPVTRLRP